MNEKQIGSDRPFRGSQLKALTRLLDALIPPSSDGRLPSAGQMDFNTYLLQQSETLIEPVKAALARLADLGREQGSGEPTDEDYLERVRQLEAEQPELFAAILSGTYACYYQQDAVLEGLGLEARPPYPKGHEVEPGDLSLLDPVRDRGPIYR